MKCICQTSNGPLSLRVHWAARDWEQHKRLPWVVFCTREVGSFSVSFISSPVFMNVIVMSLLLLWFGLNNPFLFCQTNNGMVVFTNLFVFFPVEKPNHQPKTVFVFVFF